MPLESRLNAGCVMGKRGVGLLSDVRDGGVSWKRSLSSGRGDLRFSFLGGVGSGVGAGAGGGAVGSARMGTKGKTSLTWASGLLRRIGQQLQDFMMQAAVFE